MQKTFILVLLVLMIAVVFALQNPFPVYITFWFWQLEANLSIIMIIAILFGALFSYLLSLSVMSKKNRLIREKDVKISQLEKDLEIIRVKYIPDVIGPPTTGTVSAEKHREEQNLKKVSG